MIETYWRLIEIIFDSVQVRRDGVLHSNLQLLQFHELLPLEKKDVFYQNINLTGFQLNLLDFICLESDGIYS